MTNPTKKLKGTGKDVNLSLWKVPGTLNFEHRRTPLPEKKPLFTEEIYDETSDRQTLWKAFLTKGRIKHAPEKLSETAKIIEKFLIKPLETGNRGTRHN